VPQEQPGAPAGMSLLRVEADEQDLVAAEVLCTWQSQCPPCDLHVSQTPTKLHEPSHAKALTAGSMLFHGHQRRPAAAENLALGRQLTPGSRLQAAIRLGVSPLGLSNSSKSLLARLVGKVPTTAAGPEGGARPAPTALPPAASPAKEKRPTPQKRTPKKTPRRCASLKVNQPSSARQGTERQLRALLEGLGATRFVAPVPAARGGAEVQTDLLATGRESRVVSRQNPMLKAFFTSADPSAPLPFSPDGAWYSHIKDHDIEFYTAVVYAMTGGRVVLPELAAKNLFGKKGTAGVTSPTMLHGHVLAAAVGAQEWEAMREAFSRPDTALPVPLPSPQEAVELARRARQDVDPAVEAAVTEGIAQQEKLAVYMAANVRKRKQVEPAAVAQQVDQSALRRSARSVRIQEAFARAAADGPAAAAPAGAAAAAPPGPEKPPPCDEAPSPAPVPAGQP